MKRKVRITETQLNTIIRKALKEQQEDQYMNGPNPDDMAGGTEETGNDEGGEPNYDAFLSAAQELMGQGITIGNLVDKLCENKEEPEPESGEPEPTEPDQAIPSDNQ
jgi:hypothetical protein